MEQWCDRNQNTSSIPHCKIFITYFWRFAGYIYHWKYSVIPFYECIKISVAVESGREKFTEDIKEADYKTIPLLDKSSASILGNRKMGSMVDMVSQFEVADDYAQINYNDKAVESLRLFMQAVLSGLRINQKVYLHIC